MTDWFEAIATITGFVMICIVAGVIIYACLSISFLRPVAFVLVVAFIFAGILTAAVLHHGSRGTRTLSPLSPPEHKAAVKGDPWIMIRLQAASKIEKIVDKHIETLARRRLALVKVDDYGIVDGSEWNREVQYFIDKVVRPALSDDEAYAVAQQLNSVFQKAIEDRVRVRSDEIEADLDFSTSLTPSQFETWCAKILIGRGWRATATKGSGDQGADVVAEKEGVRVILQCKLYNGTVGNKAVQEAYTAQRHYAANASAVVTNAAFSPSARDVARTTGVLLLHYSDLTRLDSLLD